MAPSSGQLPQSRGDLDALNRLAIEQISASLGVPSDLIFNGRFASKSTSQLALLNTTVAQLAKWVNLTLTTAYRQIYGEEEDESLEDPAQLVLLTSLMSSSEEVANLYSAGLLPIDTAMEASMHAIGASKEEIDKAVEKAKERDEKKQECADCTEEENKTSLSLANEEKKTTLKNLPEKQKLDLEQQREQIRQSKQASKEKANGGSSSSSA
jgi:hypothetical protein